MKSATRLTPRIACGESNVGTIDLRNRGLQAVTIMVRERAGNGDATIERHRADAGICLSLIQHLVVGADAGVGAGSTSVAG